MLKEYLIAFVEWLTGVLKTRLFWLGVISVLLFSILVARLYKLQIQDGASYYESYVSRTKREISTSAVRGNIYDRNGNPLAINEVTYNLTIKDTGDYTKRNGDYNEMLLRLIYLLDRFDVEIASECPVMIDEHGDYVFLTGQDSKIRQFIRDIYTQDEIEKQEKNGVDVYSFDAETVMKRLLSTYNFTDSWSNSQNISKEDALKICNIRYAMSATSYTRYRATTIATNIGLELQAAILESQSEMLGVEVEESTRRVYPDGVYFSNILGYTARPSSEELEELKSVDDTYTATDLVGKSGLEKVYETYLSGTKGTDTVYLNNIGMILETISSTPGVNGNDLYLTIDKDLTIATYNLLEQRLAAILVEKLTQEDFTADASMLANDFKIPIKNVYFQMINNNILDFDEFTSEDATENEQEIAATFTQYQELVLNELKNQMVDDDAVSKQDTTEEFQEYYDFIIQMISSRDRSILTGVDTEDEGYLAWRNGSLSLRAYLQYAVSKGWVDTSRLSAQQRYSDSEDAYLLLMERILELLKEDNDFTKLLYQMLINNNLLSGNRICLALIDQGILNENSAVYRELINGDEDFAFEFMKEKMTAIEITPAQIALDPCSGSSVVVDEATGEILALVSYPGYDINKFSGSVDPEYWEMVNSDMSSPLYNRATQARTAPGSTYKMITATAGLEEGVIQSDELITCLGTYDKLDHPMCWIAREQEGATHGPLNTAGGLAMSCNFYFYEVGYRLSLNENGEYDPQIGIDKLDEYAALYGFGEKSGIEIEENVSELTTEYPVTSAIGQGTNNFTTVSLARYATAVATEGTLYEFRLLDRVVDTNDNLVLEAGPTVERELEFSESTWKVLHEGMYGVTHGDGSAAAVFTGSEVEIAGKSGSAQENKLRANHGMFVSFAPYDDPEIVVAVSIPNGYTAGNAGLVSKEIYRYYFGYITMDDILNNNYSNTSGNTTISD